MLPWEGHALVGTTDEPANISEHPKPLESEIDYLVRHVTRYFNLQVERSDVKAVWSGLRPLVSDPKAADTAGLARDHIIEESESGLQTIAGGKWTTYRKMAQDSVDQAIKLFGLSAPKPDCQTENLPIVGGADYNEKGDLDLIKKYAFDEDVATHLNQTYGDQAVKVSALAAEGYGAGLLENHPILEAEVLYAVRHEMAERIIDVLARRLSVALLDTEAARMAVPRVRDIMANELGWSKERCNEETELAEKRLTEAL